MVKTKEIREKYIEENLPLVHSLCKRFTGRGVEYDDLYQAGCIGLIKSVDAFDRERGFAFSTYAVPVILGEIRRLFRDGGTVKVSRGIKELYLKTMRESRIFEQKFCREPTVNELAQIIGVSAEEITEAICAAQTPLSLTAEDENGMSVETDLPTQTLEEGVFNRILLDEAFKFLDADEVKIIKYRYYNLFSQSKTADLLNMSQVQISRAEKKILTKLRNLLV